MDFQPSVSLSHAGFHVFDMDTEVKFFTEVFGLRVTDRGVLGDRGEIAFLGADPRDHHQLVLYEGRTNTDAVHHNHVSFRVDSLQRLREIRAALEGHAGVTGVHTVNHGNAWSVYCFDPEGNRTEAFVDTPWHVSQPYEDTLELDRPDDEIIEATGKMLADDPTAQPFDKWRAQFAEKLRGAGADAE